jgi:hypothetical protein
MRTSLLLPVAMAAVAACAHRRCRPSPSPRIRCLRPGPGRVGGAGRCPPGERGGKDPPVVVVDSLFFENGFALWCTGQDDCGSRWRATNGA